MYGTVLDQRVFEHLVQRCLPSLHDHFVQADIQLSVASLPWFLSLYISSMPMVFAFRCVLLANLVPCPADSHALAASSTASSSWAQKSSSRSGQSVHSASESVELTVPLFTVSPSSSSTEPPSSRQPMMARSSSTVSAPIFARSTDSSLLHSVLKSFFATLGESAHPDSHDPRQRQVTKFQGLCTFTSLAHQHDC